MDHAHHLQSLRDILGFYKERIVLQETLLSKEISQVKVFPKKEELLGDEAKNQGKIGKKSPKKEDF